MQRKLVCNLSLSVIPNLQILLLNYGKNKLWFGLRILYLLNSTMGFIEVKNPYKSCTELGRTCRGFIWRCQWTFVVPPPLGAGGIMFSGCPSVRPSVCPSVRPSEAWNTLFWPVHGSVGPSDQPLPFYSMSVRPSGRPAGRLSVRPSREVSGHLSENAWKD